MRELWTVRDQIARRRDIAPGRILPDSAIVDAALADPKTADELTKLPIFGGNKQRRSAHVWLDALEAAPATTPNRRTPPSRRTVPRRRSRWSQRKPEAAARLDAARGALADLSARVSSRPRTSSPRNWCAGCAGTGRTPRTTPVAVDDFLRDAGARSWQRQLVVPVLAEALTVSREQA